MPHTLDRPLLPAFIYLDHAATSWPKHASVAEAMADFIANKAGNPGRGGHALARAADETVQEARLKLATLINAPSSKRVILTHGCTDAINLAIHGALEALLHKNEQADTHTPIRVVASTLEHNAVLRSLHSYAQSGAIELVIVDCDDFGVTNPNDFANACTSTTALVCLTHSSNAIGTIQPLEEAFAAVRRVAPDALTLVDCAQTLGHIAVDVQSMDIDLLAIAGHKGLGGPTGTGALYVSERAYADDGSTPRIYCHRRGGTGSKAPGLEMPTQLPTALEAGTTNAVGFAGLIAAIDAINPDTHIHEHQLTQLLYDGLAAIEGVQIYGVDGVVGRTPVVMFNLAGRSPIELAGELDRTYNIATRAGEHCAPLIHDRLGTGIAGGVRIAPGASNTIEDIENFLIAMRSIAARTHTDSLAGVVG